MIPHVNSQYIVPIDPNTHSNDMHPIARPQRWPIRRLSWVREDNLSRYAIASRRVMWDAITNLCLRYLLLVPKNLYGEFTVMASNVHVLRFPSHPVNWRGSILIKYPLLPDISDTEVASFAKGQGCRLILHENLNALRGPWSFMYVIIVFIKTLLKPVVTKTLLSERMTTKKNSSVHVSHISILEYHYHHHNHCRCRCRRRRH